MKVVDPVLSDRIGIPIEGRIVERSIDGVIVVSYDGFKLHYNRHGLLAEYGPNGIKNLFRTSEERIEKDTLGRRITEPRKERLKEYKEK